MSDSKLPSSPYKGLRPFLEDDASIFFGRDKETRIISANLRTRRLTLLYGPTGVGKSSVLGAGVLNHLKGLNKQLRLSVVGLRPEDVPIAGMKLGRGSAFGVADPYQSPVIVVVFTNWIAAPLSSLQDAVLAALKESLPEIFTDEVNEELRALKLPEMLKKISAYPEVVELLIILDQFEQYFVYHPIDDEKPGEFDDEFCRAVSSRDVHANFLISIREDWLARLDRFKGRIANLFDNAIRINHLDRESAEAAITKPIEKYNELLKENKGGATSDRPKVIIEDSFVPELLNQLEALDEVNHAPSNVSFARRESQLKQRRIQASNLQIVLRNLWEKIKDDPVPTLAFDLVRNPETAKLIIQSNLEKTLEQLTPEEKTLAAELFRFMVTTSGAKLAETADGLADQSGRSPQEIKVLLDKLCGRKFRILSQVQPPPDQSLDHLRYELTSDALAAPIREWIGDIRAENRRRKVQRNYIISIAGLIVIFVMLFLFASLIRARRQRRIANEQARLLQQQKEKADRALAAVRRLDDQVPYSKAVLRGHGARVTSATFTPNGRVLTASADGSAILWDIETKNPIKEFRHGNSPLIGAAINPDGDRVVTTSVDGRVILWTVDSQDTVQLRGPEPNHITGISFNKAGDIIAGATTAGAVIVWDLNTISAVREIPGNGAAIRQLVFSPSGNLLAAASEDRNVRIWRVGDWAQVNTLVGHTDIVNSVAFSPDEKFIATASADTTVRVWDLSTNTAVRTLWGHAKSINSVDFNDDGKRLLTASDDTTARVWIIETSKSIPLVGHADRVISASFSPSSQQVVTGSADGVVRMWSATTGSSMAEFRGHIDQVNYVSYSHDGQYVLTAGEDATARIWYARESGELRIDPQPTIVAYPGSYRGSCPVTITFLTKITALSGSGRVKYRFIASDGRAWPRELLFDQPSTQTINWYWRITNNYSGFEKLEIIEPKGIKEQKAMFTVKCTNVEIATPSPTPDSTPVPAGTP